MSIKLLKLERKKKSKRKKSTEWSQVQYWQVLPCESCYFYFWDKLFALNTEILDNPCQENFP